AVAVDPAQQVLGPCEGLLPLRLPFGRRRLRCRGKGKARDCERTEPDHCGTHDLPRSPARTALRADTKVPAWRFCGVRHDKAFVGPAYGRTGAGAGPSTLDRDKGSWDNGVIPGGSDTCREPGMRPGLIAILVLCVSAISAVAADDRADERRRMVETIEAHAGSPEGGLAGGHTDAPVLEAMRAVPRHEFVPAEVSGQAYADRSLPIGLGQTVSQPYIVALMTHLLEVKPGDRILEIGTGSGYQAAVLARLAGEVYSVEIVEELARRA